CLFGQSGRSKLCLSANVKCRRFWILQKRKNKISLRLSESSPYGMTIFSKHPFLILRVCIKHLSIAEIKRDGIGICISIRLYYARLRSKNSWSVTRCWQTPSVILPQKWPQNDYNSFRIYTINEKDNERNYTTNTKGAHNSVW